MANIFDFFEKWGDYDFRRLHLQEADIIAFGLLTYTSFEETKYYKSLENKDSFFELSRFAKEDMKELNQTNLVPGGYKKFLNKIFSIKRYKRIKVGYFKDEVSTDLGVQFFAYTISFSSFNIICFRGTDTSIVGWEEDLNMAVKKIVPAQVEALNYVKKIASIDDKKLYILGHSKGGNLAYFSFFNVDESVKNRVEKVYNLDGPGFKIDEYEYAKYSKKLAKIVPNDDIVGILFDNSNDFSIAKSNSLSIYAHDLATWELDKNTDFKNIKYVQKLTPSSEALQHAFHDWIKELDEEEVSQFIVYIFKIFYSNNQHNIMNLKVDLIKSAKIYIKWISNNTPENGFEIKKHSLSFLKLYFQYLFLIKKPKLANRRKQ